MRESGKQPDKLSLPHRVRGQAFPLGMALLLFGSLSGFVLYNTIQTASDKTRLANTADAAAYSGLQWQARALNFQAYTNRAMVANQVSIAQGVSLASWSKYGVVTVANISTVLSWVPVLNGILEGVETAVRAVDQVLTPIANSMVNVVDKVNKGLSIAQESMYYGSFAATPSIVDTVVSETDPRFETSSAYNLYGVASNLGRWESFTSGFDDEDLPAMIERQNMINHSLDEFSRSRNWDFFDFWMYSTPVTRHKIMRRGQTGLFMIQEGGKIKWEWKAKDTVSAHTRIWRIRGEKKLEVPIGWGRAFANSDGSSDSMEPGENCERGKRCSPNRWTPQNPQAEQLADEGYGIDGTSAESIATGYTGIQNYRSLSEETIDEDDPAIHLKVEVSMPLDKVQSTEQMGTSDTFHTDMVSVGQSASSVSVAEVFFERPDLHLNEDARYENANGYNPYWDVRLSPVEDKERLLALSMRAAASSASAPSSSQPEGGEEDATQSPEQRSLAQGSSGSRARTRVDTEGGPIALASIVGSDLTLPDVEIPASIDAQAAVSALMQAYGVEGLPDTSEYSQYISLVQDGDPEALFRHFAGEAIDDVKNQIKEAVEDVLKDAVEDMLKGIVTSYASSYVGTDVNALVSEVESLAESDFDSVMADTEIGEIAETVEEGRQEMLEYRDEYQRIRDEIVDAFGTAMTDVKSDIAARVGEFDSQIAALREEAETAGSTLERERIRAEIETLLEERQAVQDSLQVELEDALMEIFDEVTDDPEHFNREMARYAVVEMLNNAEDTLEFEWAAELDEEGNENSLTYGYEDEDEDLEEIRNSRGW